MWLNLIKSHWGDCVNLVAHVHDPSLRFSVGWFWRSNFIGDTQRYLEVWLAKDTVLASWRITLWTKHTIFDHIIVIYHFSWLLAVEWAKRPYNNENNLLKWMLAKHRPDIRSFLLQRSFLFHVLACRPGCKGSHPFLSLTLTAFG